MKILTTLIYIAGLQSLSFAQTKGSVPPQRYENPNKVQYVVTSARPDIQVAKFTPSTESRNIIITGIPASASRLTTVNIDFDTMGSFAFKKDAGLKIPSTSEVFIEDKLNGKIFNLKNTGAYQFNVDEKTENRFVLHILDKSIPEEVVTSN